jgi:hypothetical protein
VFVKCSLFQAETRGPSKYPVFAALAVSETKRGEKKKKKKKTRTRGKITEITRWMQYCSKVYSSTTMHPIYTRVVIRVLTKRPSTFICSAGRPSPWRTRFFENVNCLRIAFTSNKVPDVPCTFLEDASDVVIPLRVEHYDGGKKTDHVP